ncbi:GTPase Der [secondary endosymbiont of Trabutina mannipara]|uniref:GTPase Der n=1 Tax=secondary endosymbiont of Trabutina mannipara TaxID=1835721 RepID=A0A1C3L434_9ENTR|nr:ribosome biogenesis GTPase Der [secondary endosymbiont of Trabutina mannipara]SBT81969.1 GTPase Der [secondary endosymbiont of Trabutina mannipara]
MIPVVTIVGRPNVGKSTLFNQLTRTRDALVTDFQGLTRDRKYGRAKWSGHEFIVIDTGGIDNTKRGIETIITGQSLLAIKEADIVLFLVDGQSGIMEADQNIAKHLRSCRKKTVIVVNKTERLSTDSTCYFCNLGIDNIVSISAKYGRGFNNLIEHILLVSNNLPGADNNYDKADILALAPDAKEKKIEQSLLPIKIAIVGCPNVGKSTLINCLLGQKRVVVYDNPGTTRDSIYIPKVRNKREYILIDTAGVRKRSKVTDKVEKFSIIKTLQAIEYANVVLLVIDAYKGISDQDLYLLSFILKSGRSLVIAVNKFDDLYSPKRNEIKKTLNHHLKFLSFARVHFISALHNRGISNIYKSVNEAYQCATIRFSTALLTRIMHNAVNEYQLPFSDRVKLKYAHAGGYNPLILVMHGTKVKNIPNTYKRYLINYFQRSLEIIGTQIRIHFNESVNHYVVK